MCDVLPTHRAPDVIHQHVSDASRAPGRPSRFWARAAAEICGMCSCSAMAATSLSSRPHKAMQSSSVMFIGSSAYPILPEPRGGPVVRCALSAERAGQRTKRPLGDRADGALESPRLQWAHDLTSIRPSSFLNKVNRCRARGSNRTEFSPIPPNPIRPA